MSQDKAASLSSSLFARKGRASPSSLLIAELKGGTAPVDAEEVPTDLHDLHEGAPLKRSALDLKGQPTRKTAREGGGELPLLAFVEAQIAAERSDQTAEDGAIDDSALADEPNPPASLLGRGSAGLRRANGRHMDGPAATAEQVASAAQRPVQVTVLEPDATDEPAEALGEVEAETVSGDANVTAIEDAPGEESESPAAAEAEAAAEAGPQGEGPQEAAGGAPYEAEAQGGPSEAEAPPESAVAPAEGASKTTDEKEAAPPGAADEFPTPSPQLQAASDAAMSAGRVFQQAAARRAETSGRPVQSVPKTAVAPSKPQAAKLWRSAAVITLGAALGFGAYVYLSPGGEPEKLQQASAPVVETLPEPAPESAPLSPQVQATDSGELPDAGPPDHQVTAAALPEPSFDIIRIEPDGQSIIAGRALPFSEWILLNNGSPIASVKADANGEWVVLPDASLVPGANAFSLVPKTERGKVTIPAPASPQPEPESAAPAAPDGPKAEVSSADDPQIALPRSKPEDLPAAAPPAYRTAAEGDYEIQLASVRQSSDAEREKQRLVEAYPGLLGQLELHVQEAAVDGAGRFYRVRSGALAHLGEAREVCRRLEGAGQGCLVVKREKVAALPEPHERGAIAQEGQTSPMPPHQQAERP